MQSTPPGQDAHNQQPQSTPSATEPSKAPLQLEPEHQPQKTENSSPFFYIEGSNDLPDPQQDLHLPVRDEPDDLTHQQIPFVLPFQPSGPLPTQTQPDTHTAFNTAQTPPTPGAATTHQSRTMRLLKRGLIIGMILLIIVGTSAVIFAQATSPTPSTTHSLPLPPTQKTRSLTPVPTVKKTSQGATATPTPMPASTPIPTPVPAQPTMMPGNTTPPQSGLPSIQQLDQLGWTKIGLTEADALEAERTATTFTDREMSFDYRNIGTIAHHSGTLTAATFLLTAGAQARFQANDLRVINNMLYNTITQQRLIQQVANPEPSLVQMQSPSLQGQRQTIAWVTVSFTLLSSQQEPSGQRTENLEIDPSNGQPLVRHMDVVLLRVPPDTQGTTAPMGGTGWLVNTYALDSSTLPLFATQPTL